MARLRLARRVTDASPPRPWVKPLPAVRAAPLATAHAALHVVGPRDAPPEGAEVTLLLPSLALVAYVPAPPHSGAPAEVAPDPMLRGNAFRVLHESPRTLGAAISIAAGRRMESGPESERLFIVLRGNGLVFLQNEETMKFSPLDAIFVPAGEPVRVWSQGPEDALALALQPRDIKTQPRRTLASEVRRLKEAAPGPDTRREPTP